ncbi:hypothetical protein LJB83_01490 [Clostridia bacterium OttesenSCG-928-F22]|nr:hypothetical protein [Clostridia bacterium OttesenSCG-928-F22]
MESMSDKIPAASAIDQVQSITEESSYFDDKDLLDQAKQRLASKRNLIGQVLDFCLILVILFTITFTWDGGTRIALAVLLCAFWGIRLIIRFVKFAKPLFKDGISSYFRERKERKQERHEQRVKVEYNRMKKAGIGYASSDFSK